jgi:hypothetical protein
MMYAALVAVMLLSLFLIPLGLPGTWVMVAAAAAYGPLTGSPLRVGLVIGAVLLAIAGEVADVLLAGKYAKQYGGSRRAAWGAIGGGLLGALVGVPVPIIGSIVGAFLGAFGGALVAELTTGSGRDIATRAATGAVVGRATAAVFKIGVGIAIAGLVLTAS